jgi:CRISPR/Cas system CMR-associated protein Cmr5 small subunit
MQNLNQIRACHVLTFATSSVNKRGQNDGEVIKKIPPVIMNNGLLAALAYSMDKKQEAWRLVFDAVASHLASKEISLIPEEKNTAELLLDYLSCEADSTVLRNVTAETYEWLNFARRLVK